MTFLRAVIVSFSLYILNCKRTFKEEGAVFHKNKDKSRESKQVQQPKDSRKKIEPKSYCSRMYKFLMNNLDKSCSYLA